MHTDRTLDLENLETVFEGDHESIADLLELACADGRERLVAMETALSTGDATTARGLAHAIKGASSNVGAFELADVAAKVETALRGGALALACEQQLELTDAFTRFEKAVVAYRMPS